MARRVNPLRVGVALIAFAALALVGRYVWIGPISGVVVDKRSGQPIANAWVIANYNGSEFWSFVPHGGTRGVCFGALLTKTDGDGKYRFPAFSLSNPLTAIEHREKSAHVASFVAGYSYMNPRFPDKRSDPAAHNFPQAVATHWRSNVRVVGTTIELFPSVDSATDRMGSLVDVAEHWACAHSATDLEWLKFYRDLYQASLDLKIPENRPPFHMYPARICNVAIGSLILEPREDGCPWEATPIGRELGRESLLAMGLADPEQYPLVKAIRRKQFDRISDLTGDPERLRETDTLGFNALHASLESPETIPLAADFLKRGLDVNAKSGHGVTPLMIAAAHTDVDTVKWLLDLGAKINDSNADGTTPLMYAASAGNNDIVKLLMARGAKINVRNNKNETALSLARQQKYTPVVATLRTAGAR